METDRRRLVAERIAEARRAAGLSKGALGARVGIRLWLVDRIEAGSATPPEELVEQIAEATGRSSAWLRGEDEGPSAPASLAAATTQRRPATGTLPEPAAELAELAADQADIGRALIRREIRLEMDESPVEAESLESGTETQPPRPLRPAGRAVAS